MSIFDVLCTSESKHFEIHSLSEKILNYAQLKKAVRERATELSATYAAKTLYAFAAPTNVQSGIEILAALEADLIPIPQSSFLSGEQQHAQLQNMLKDLSLETLEPGLMIATSGSSGQPKLVYLSVRALVESAKRVSEELQFSGASTWLLGLPLFHVGGLGILLRALYRGASVVIPQDLKVGPEIFGASKRVDFVSFVPTQLGRFLEQHTKLLVDAKLKVVLLGGGATPWRWLQQALQTQLPLVRSYGMSETSSMIVGTAKGEELGKPQESLSSGQPMNGVRLKISEEGRILVKSPTLFEGYLVPHQGFARVVLDGEDYFKTEDQGFIGANGDLHVLGRVGRAFKIAGELFQPEILEKLLLSHPAVKTARVIKVAHQDYVTAASAEISVFTDAPGSIALVHELNELCLQALPGIFRPQQITVVDDKDLTRAKSTKELL